MKCYCEVVIQVYSSVLSGLIAWRMGQRKQKSQGKEKKIKKSGTPQKDVDDVLRLVPRDLEQAQEQPPGNPYQESGALKTRSVGWRAR